MMEIGTFNKKITIQKKEVIEDGIGNQSDKWIDFHSCWAEVKEIYGREYWEARQTNEEKTIKFTIRYCKKLENINSTDYRIFFKGNQYDIYVVNNKSSNRYIYIKAISEYDRGVSYE